jgi:hypothetical protein
VSALDCRKRRSPLRRRDFDTRKELSTIITKSRELGYPGIELDARLALTESEMKAGQTTAGRAHLATILRNLRSRLSVASLSG